MIHPDAETAPAPPSAIPEAATVVICAFTMNRWSNLRQAIESVLSQLTEGDECLVVIDHNDQLLKLASAEFAGRPGVSVTPSSGPKGLSGARNTAVAHATGQIVAFLDDDAVAAPEWLAALREALSLDGVMGVGTAAHPNWPGDTRPAWFPREFDWVVGCSYVGMPTAQAEVRNVIGATMAFRREAFDLAGTFSTQVGRIGTVPTGCEETELCIRLRNNKPGARILYLPHVAVAHTVTAERMRVGYFLRRCLGEGRSKARVARLVGSQDALSSERSYVTSTLPRGVRRELGRGLRGHFSGWKAAALIVAGVFLASLGYVEGRLIREAEH